jgi:hypothetical protein
LRLIEKAIRIERVRAIIGMKQDLEDLRVKDSPCKARAARIGTPTAEGTNMRSSQTGRIKYERRQMSKGYPTIVKAKRDSPIK